jgi:hypothetical protein
MAFDLITWAIGFSLSKIASNAIDRSNNQSFSNELNKIVEDWANYLPTDIYVNPNSIFPVQNIFVENENYSLSVLKEKIISKILPTQSDWFTAILEQWRMIKLKLGDDSQSFYNLSESEASIHIDNLSQQLYQKSKLNTDLFKNKVLNDLEIIKNKLDALLPKEDVQNIITSKLLIIKDLKNSFDILSTCWPINPLFTRDTESYTIIHEIVEKIILDVHYTYSIILPYAELEKISSKVKTKKNDLIFSLNTYLDAVDLFYNGDVNSVIQLFEDDSPKGDANFNIEKWKQIIALMREYLKRELEKE